jgi:hypothetical protein
MKYRKKPEVVNAVIWNGNEFENGIPSWIGNALRSKPGSKGSVFRTGDKVQVFASDGMMIADPGDWIIKTKNGDMYPCKPDVFKTLYEKMEETNNIDTLKMAYRYIYLLDKAVGQEELASCLRDALCESIGDREFKEWLSDMDYKNLPKGNAQGCPRDGHFSKESK